MSASEGLQLIPCFERLPSWFSAAQVWPRRVMWDHLCGNRALVTCLVTETTAAVNQSRAWGYGGCVFISLSFNAFHGAKLISLLSLWASDPIFGRWCRKTWREHATARGCTIGLLQPRLIIAIPVPPEDVFDISSRSIIHPGYQAEDGELCWNKHLISQATWAGLNPGMTWRERA